MNINQLETEAIQAIERHKTSVLSSKTFPVVQIWNSRKLLDDFPISMVYIGFHKGKHVYNLDAHQILRYIERYKAEFC